MKRYHVLLCVAVAGMLILLAKYLLPLSSGSSESGLSFQSECETDNRTIETKNEFDCLTAIQVENVRVLVKVWGFLKYYHPAVTKGQKDWDAELIELLPRLLDVQNTNDRNAFLNSWVQSLGPVQACLECSKIDPEAAMQANLEWIYDERELGQALSVRLIGIFTNRQLGDDQFYAGYGRVGEASFANEKGYHDLKYYESDNLKARYRLLAVARYWNIIAYWFPYRDLIEKDWDIVLGEYLVRAAQSDTYLKYRQTMARLIAEVGDTHAGINQRSVLPPRGRCSLPVEIRFIENFATVVEFRDPDAGRETGLKVGDIIDSIGDANIETLLSHMRPFYGASNRAAQNLEMSKNLLRGPCGQVALQVRRAGESLAINTERTLGDDQYGYRIPLPHDRAGDTAQILEGNIGYLKLSSVKTEDVPEYIEKFRGTKALIIDIRNYPSAFMPFALGQWFAVEGTHFAKFTTPDFHTPGSFKWRNGRPIAPIRTGKRLELPIAILLDEASISQSEFTAMAFRALPDTIIVGSQTAGADGDITRIKLPGGIVSQISGMGVFYPDGTPTQKIGIIPDIEVHPTRSGIMSGKDEVLERAVIELKRLSEGPN